MNIERTIIDESADVLYIDGPVLIRSNSLTINKIVVSGSFDCGFLTDHSMHVEDSNRDYPLVELRGNGCRVGDVVIYGGASMQSKQDWKNTVMGGLKVTGTGNIVGRCFAGCVHVPYMSTGTDNKLVSLKGEYFSGDGFGLCADRNEIMRAELKAGLDVYPYEEYHRDVGMMYQSSDGTNVIDSCNVYNLNYSDSEHPWNDPAMQGVLIDGVAFDCGVYNFTVSGVIHSEHGVSFADADECEVMNIDTRSAVNWAKKSECNLDRANRSCGGWTK